MKKNGTKPEKKKTPSYEGGKVRDWSIKHEQLKGAGISGEKFLELLRKTVSRKQTAQ